MSEEILYLKLDAKIKVSDPHVRIGDLGSLYCKNQDISNKVKTLKVYKLQESDKDRCVISALKVIELIQTEYPSLTIESLGETEIIVDLVSGKDGNKWKAGIKIALVSILCFFGTMYTIMAYHNDIGIHELFANVYAMVMGKESDGYTILELSYSIGLSVGITLFYNHIGKRRLTPDPSPVEVEMRTYSDDVNRALVELANREEKTIDVS